MLIKEIDKTIEIKIVYYGPALSGKTKSIEALFKHYGKQDGLLSIESTVERTLFFDYGVINFRGELWNLKVHLYGTTGQDFYIVTRPITLEGVDGLIFVADSQKKACDRNVNSWNELKTFYKDDLIKFPMVVCFNKQDLPNKFDSDAFLDDINYSKYQKIATQKTTALTGLGIYESFINLLKFFFEGLSVPETMQALT